jgi:nitroimidazol reductase NimA-like FMN-containing flavoprotein (pyridoxamine 5'-phosphate oxidase superfamily)
MTLVDPRTWMQQLTAEQCWDLLAGVPVGRLAVLVDSLPEVYPVNFAVDGRSIVFRTDEGNKLRGLGRSPSVCFEADELDVEAKSGWSVLVKGTAREITDSEERRRAEALSLEFWARGAKSRWVRIEPFAISGRRIASPGAGATATTGLTYDGPAALVTSGGDSFAECHLRARPTDGGWDGQLTDIMFRTQMVPVPLQPEERIQLLEAPGRPVLTVTVRNEERGTAYVSGTNPS